MEDVDILAETAWDGGRGKAGRAAAGRGTGGGATGPGRAGEGGGDVQVSWERRECVRKVANVSE